MKKKPYTIVCVLDTEFKPFMIKVESSEPVGVLKNMIKDARPELAGIAACNLKLYQVEISKDDDIARTATQKLAENPAELPDLEELADIFDDGPKKKMVHIIVQPPKVEVTPRDPRDEDPAEMENFKRMLKCAPSSLSRPSQFRSAADGAVYCNRPFDYNTIPIDLFQPEFGDFKKDCRMTPTTWAQNLLQELTAAACMWYNNESARRAAILEVFKNAGIYFGAETIGGTDYHTDGNLQVLIMPASLRECKNESGCALMEAIAYYVQFLRIAYSSHRNSHFPCILIVDVGPCIAFYGCLLAGKHVHVEPLTPTYDLTTHWTDEMARNAIASSLDAFKKAIGSIRKHYEALALAPTLVPLVGSTFPYPTNYTDDAGQEVKFTYQSRIDDKLVFRASVDSDVEGDLCVKFTKRYSAEAHRFLAELGHAPRLRGVTSLPGDWIMVVMDFSPHTQLSVISPPSIEWWNLVKSKIRDVVQNLHNNGFVHGDIREVNILVDTNTPTPGHDISVHLIDFDWAGKDQEVRYPGRVNTITVSRPDGVSDGELITKGHDMEMVLRLC